MSNRVQIDAVLVVLVSLIIIPKLTIPQKYLAIFLSLHFLYFCKNPSSPFNSQDVVDPIILHALYRDGLVFLTLSFVAIYTKIKNDLVLRVIIVFSAIVLVLKSVGLVKPTGLGGTLTIDAAFVAVGSLYFKGYQRFLIALSALTSMSTTVLGIVFLSFLGVNKLLAAAVIPLFFIPGINLTSPDRLQVWKEAVLYTIRHSPLVGNGIGSFNAIGPTFNSLDTTHVFQTAHNEFIGLFFDFGIVGLILWLWVIYDFYLRVEPGKKIVFDIILILCIFHSVFRQGIFIAFLI